MLEIGRDGLGGYNPEGIDSDYCPRAALRPVTGSGKAEYPRASPKNIEPWVPETDPSVMDGASEPWLGGRSCSYRTVAAFPPPWHNGHS